MRRGRRERAFAEFDRSGRTAPPVFAAFQSGPLGQYRLGVGTINLEFCGYTATDSMLTSGDHGAGSVLLASFENSATPFSVDVTEFINSRIPAGDAFAGPAHDDFLP